MLFKQRSWRIYSYTLINHYHFAHIDTRIKYLHEKLSFLFYLNVHFYMHVKQLRKLFYNKVAIVIFIAPLLC